MSLFARVLLGSALFLGHIATSAADEQTITRRAPLGKTEQLVFEHPGRWSFDISREAEDMFRPAIRLRRPSEGGPEGVKIKVYSALDTKGEIGGEKQLVTSVEAMGKSVRPDAKAEVLPLKVREGIGAYTTVVDEGLAQDVDRGPWRFPYHTLGQVKLGALVITVKAETNSKDHDDYRDLVHLLESIRVEPRTDAPQADPAPSPEPTRGYPQNAPF
jgi:hypothetical protein